jgi:hypothetical protein
MSKSQQRRLAVQRGKTTQSRGETMQNERSKSVESRHTGNQDILGRK